MFIAFVVLIYLIDAGLNVLALRRIDLRRLQFIDGVLIGLTYYVTIPFAVILLSGRIGAQFLNIEAYYPYQDSATTAAILIGSIALSLLKLLMASPAGRRLKAGGALAARGRRAKHGRGRPAPSGTAHSSIQYLKTVTWILLVLYFTTTVTIFFKSGVAAGDHWYHATSELMAESPVFLLIKYVSNFARTAAFAALGLLAILVPRYWPRIVATGCLLALADLFMTFNRITVVYFLLMLVIIFWRRIYLVLAFVFATLFSSIYISSLWPEFRGQVSNFGYSVTGMSHALARTIEVNSVARPFVEEMNGVFESLNFTVLNWIIQHRDQLDVSFGSYFVRPLGAFIPRAIWPSRPESFASTVGHQLSNSELAVNSFLFGEPFANNVLFWPAMLILVVLIYDWCFRKMSNYNPVWGAIGAFIAFAWWRFDSSFAAVCLVFSFMLFGALFAVAPARRLPARGRRRARAQYRGPAIDPIS